MLFVPKELDAIYLNDASKRFLGESTDELSFSYFDLFPELNIEELQSFLRSTDQEGFEVVKFNSKLKKIIRHDFDRVEDGYFIKISIENIEASKNSMLLQTVNLLNSFTDISPQIEAEKKLEENRELLSLMVSTSTSYINISEEVLPETIQNSLKKLGRFVEADRMYIFEYNWEENTCSNTFEWCENDIEPQIDSLQNIPLVGLENWTTRHRSGKIMDVKDVFALKENDSLRQILEPQGIKSLMTVPIMGNHDCLGFIGLDSVKKVHNYSENETNLLKIFSGIIANVHTRLNRERDLKERIKELRTIYQVSQLANQELNSESEFFQKIVDIIPPGFFIPDETSARLVYKNKKFTSSGFKKSDKCIEEKILVNGKALGVLQVFIPNHKNFLPEEYSLIKTIVNNLDQHLSANENLIKIKNNETRIRSLLESQTNYVIRTDLNGIHTFWNKKFQEDFSHCYAKDLNQENALSSICEYHHQRARETVVKCLESPGSVFQVELDKPGKDGKILSTLWEFCCITDSEGIPFEMQCVGIDITERRKTLEKLESSERRLVQFTDHTNSIIWETNDQGLFTYISHACERIFGYHPDEIINKKYFFDLFPPEYRNEYTQLGKGNLEKNGSVLEFENPIQKKNGEIIWVATHAILIKDEQGNTLKILGVDNDITERKRQEQKIKDQNDRLRAIIEAIPDILYVMDQDGNYIEYYESSNQNIIGDFSFLVGKNLSEIFPPEEAALHLEKIKSSLRTGQVETYDYQGMVGFEDRFFESRIIAMSSTKVLRFVREITKRKKAELEIKKLSKAVEQSPVAIVITNLDGKIEYINSSYEALINKPTKKILGTHLSYISSIFKNHTTKEEFWKDLKEGNPYSFEIHRMELDQTNWDQVTITPIQNEKDDIINLLVIIQDVTQRKEFENQILDLNSSLEKRIEKRTEELRNSNLELRKAQLEAESANQAKSEFLSRMSHELRTPMNSILGFAQLLEFSDLNNKQKRNLEYIIKSGDHLLNLINEVLDISRIESGIETISLETIELNQLISEMAEIFMPSAKTKSITINVLNSKEEKIHIKADLQRLKQILINLINNAIKYNFENGVITIFYENLSDQITRVHIKDSGIGISSADLPKLFLPFERASNINSEIEGTGLGLAVVEKLAKLMNLKVGVSSELGIGSDFWIDIPVDNESHIQLEKEIKSEPFINTQSKVHHLLLVEDNQTNIELINELLTHVKPNCLLHAVMTKEEALFMAREFHPSLILLDLNLPSIHGSEILEAFKSDTDLSKIPVVIISADATSLQIESLLKKGADNYITKPISLKKMIKILEEYLS